MKRIKLDMRTMLRSKVTLIFMMLGLLIAVPAVALAQDAGDPTGATSPAPPAPTIQSDKEDYPPADTVILTGLGWQPGETVNINVNDDEGQTWNRNVDVIADENGGVRDEFVLPDWFVATYSVTATGSSGAIATWTFTDSHLPNRGCDSLVPLPHSLPVAIVVDTTLDEFDNNSNSAIGPCSLREAISAANATTSIDSIVGPGGSPLAGTYTLTRTEGGSGDRPGEGDNSNLRGDLDITNSLTINGAGAQTTIIEAGKTPGNGIDRVLHFQASGTSELSGVTVRHGQISDDGGGIKTDRSLTLTDVAITENDATADATTGKKSGGGIFHQADDNNFTSERLTLNRVTISGNTASLDGGGLRSTANSGATLTNVAITDNQAGNGGGISYQGNSLTHNGGTISGNTASLDGGGLHTMSGNVSLTDVAITDNEARNGGGISHQGSQLQSNFMTISGNTASLDGGGLYSFGTTSGSGGLTNVTITNNSAAGNGGGLRAALPNLSLSQATVSHNSAPDGSNISRSTGFVSLRNTIVSNPNPKLISGGDNPYGTGANCAGVVSNFRNNLESLTNTCGFGSANFSKSGPNVKANLGDLANNGGPTETRALLSGSAAIDAGSDFVGTSLDQRHESRPKDGDGNDTDGRADNGNAEHDIGAYELQAPITLDNTAPVITKVVTGTLGLNSWYTSNVEVDWTVVDDESTISSQSGCDDFSVTSDQQATTYTCEVTSAGGTSSDSVTIKRDASAPNFNCDSADGNWHATDVNIACTASDGGSGLADDTNDTSFNLSTSVANGAENSNASTGSRTVADNAGNSSTAGPITGIKVDRKDPDVQCGSADADWHANDVSIACTATDGGSDLANSGDASFNLTTNVAADTEDSNASTDSRPVLDDAGNSATAGPISGNKVDKKDPSFNCDSADANWHATNQTFNCTANDGGSGLTPSTDANFSLSTTVAADNETSNASTGTKDLTDSVGNTVTAPAITGVKVDRKAPVLTDDGPTPTNPNGASNWYTSAVTYKYTATDGGSGFAPNGDLTKSITNSSGTNEGNAVTIASGPVSDAVGNSAASIDSAALKIDLSDPTNVTFQGDPAADGSYDFGDTPAKPTCTADDAVSGFASCEVTGYSTAVGSHTMTATAKDNADRTATATRTYTVKAWTFSGFYQPVDINGTLNTVKGGSTVPIKFELFKGATELTDTANVKQPLQAQTVNCTSGTGVEDPIELTATGGTSLRYDSTAGQYIYNWKTPTGAGTCYKVTITALDGLTQTALFKLK